MIKKISYILLTTIVLLSLSILLYNSYVQSVMEDELVRYSENNLYEKFKPVKSNNESPAILLVHGYGGSPYDGKPLLDTLYKLGVTYYSPLLPGHGKAPCDLEVSTKEQWQNAAEKAYLELKDQYDEVYLIGFSMGVAISVSLSAKYDIDKLILINPYFRTTMKWYYLTNLENTARLLAPFIPYVIKPRKGQINDPEGLDNYESLKIIPTGSTKELNKIGEQAQLDASELEGSILWFHAVNDDVASFDLSYKAYESAISENKHFIRLENSNHVALYDYDSELIIKEILIFIGGDAK